MTNIMNPAFRVSLFQSKRQSAKSTLEKLHLYIEQMKAENRKPDLIALSEFAIEDLDGISISKHDISFDGNSLGLIQSFAREHKVAVLPGSFMASAEGKTYNVAVYIDSNGTIKAQRRKYYCGAQDASYDWGTEEEDGICCYDDPAGIGKFALLICSESESFMAELANFYNDAGNSLPFVLVPACIEVKKGETLNLDRRSCLEDTRKSQLSFALNSFTEKSNKYGLPYFRIDQALGETPRGGITLGNTLIAHPTLGRAISIPEEGFLEASIDNSGKLIGTSESILSFPPLP